MTQRGDNAATDSEPSFPKLDAFITPLLPRARGLQVDRHSVAAFWTRVKWVRFLLRRVSGGVTLSVV